MKPFAIALFATLLRAQDPAGIIQGSLRDAVTRAPVAAARISLRGPAARAATTAPGGDFQFAQLPPGDYDLSVEKSGYLDSARGSAPQAVRLKPSALSESVVIDLTPLGAMEGAVSDEEGKPLPGVYVTVAGESHTTDQAGRFTFEDIVPGSYRVAVNVPHPVRSANLSRDPATGDFYGYAPAQYYPGSTDALLAIPVAIPAGTRLRNINLRLRRTLLVEFSGRLVEMSGGEPVVGGMVQLLAAVPGTPDPLWRQHPTGDGGSFRFSLLQPGAYTLAVYRLGRSPLPYLVPIEIGKAGADDLAVAIPPFPRIQGSIQMRDSKLQWEGTLNVFLRHRYGASAACVVKPDGSFECDNVPPGDYTVDGQPRNLRLVSDRSRRLSVNSIRFGAQDGFRKPITVLENGNPPLEIQLTDNPAGIAGTVVDSGARGGTSYLVTVATVAPRRTLSAVINASPGFQFPDLSPGDYDVTAWRFTPAARSATLAATFTATANACDETVRVTVRDGAVSSITVRPCP